MFRVATRSFDDRPALQQAISIESENLAYLYGTVSRNSLYAAAQSSGETVVTDFRTGRARPISAQELSDLFTLDLANTLEHAPRMYLRPDFMDMYRGASRLLPPPALQALDQWAENARTQSWARRWVMRSRFYAGWLLVRISSRVRGLASSGRKHR
jgi:hypothetical protein